MLLLIFKSIAILNNRLKVIVILEFFKKTIVFDKFKKQIVMQKHILIKKATKIDSVINNTITYSL